MEFVTNIGYFFCLILMICTFYMTCLAFSTIFCSTRNISDTKIGKSIVGNTYETVIPQTLIYSFHNKKEFMLTKDNLQSYVQFSFYIKISPGIKFKVIKVLEQRGIDSGACLAFTIELLDDIPIDDILEYSEIDVKDGFKLPQKIKKNILDSANPNLNIILNKNNGLSTKKLIVGCDSEFFKYNYDGIFLRKPIKHNKTIIKRIK